MKKEPFNFMDNYSNWRFFFHFLGHLLHVIDSAYGTCTVADAFHRRCAKNLLQEAGHTDRMSALKHRFARFAQVLDADGAFRCLHDRFSHDWKISDGGEELFGFVGKGRRTHTSLR